MEQDDRNDVGSLVFQGWLVFCALWMVCWIYLGFGSLTTYETHPLAMSIYLAIFAAWVLLVAFERDGNSSLRSTWDTALIGIVRVYLLRGNDNVDLWELYVLTGICTVLWIGNVLFAGRSQSRMQLAGPGAPAANDPPRQETRTRPPELRYRAAKARRTFADVIGMDETKAKLKSAAVEITGASEGVSHRNGILLFGPPGTGKTFLAEALAGEMNLPILSITGGDFANKYINATTEELVRAFNDAEAQQPCVLFLDEADSILVDRASIVNADSEKNQIVATMLTRLTRLQSLRIVFIAATNYPERLDAAGSREGRFDFRIEIPAPDLMARRGILVSSLKRYCPKLSYDQKMIDRAARRFEGFSAKRMEAIAQELSVMTRERNISALDLAVVLEALRRIQGRRGMLPETTLSLDELVLSAEMRAQLNSLALRMTSIDQIEALGGTVPSGVLFSGPPGTGKTAAVKALAKSSGWAFLSTTGNELIGNPAKLDDILKEAKDIRPTIIFIDEADDVLADRSAFGNPAISVTNKLLSVIDGAGGKVPDIVFVAATNHLEAIDPAALRGGRFTEKAVFDLPSASATAVFVALWQIKAGEMAATLRPADVVDELAGLAYADLQAILQDAVNLAITRKLGGGLGTIQKADIVAARRRVVGAQK